MNSKINKVVILDSWCKEAMSILKPISKVGNKFTPLTRDKVMGVVTTLSLNKKAERFFSDVLEAPGYYGKKFIDWYPNLKFVASCTTGLDHIDTEYCREKGIKIISLQGETDFLQDVWATAEHTWSLILSLIRKVPFAFDDVKRGNWNREAWQGTELRGKTLGIVGYGRVGRQVAKIAEAFGMNIIWEDNFRDAGFTRRKLLQESDIVTVHVSLNESSKGMFGAEQFAMMKPTAYFINTSRGAVVNTYDLVQALRRGVIAGAALDVLDGEPKVRVTRELIEDLGNLLITPHIAGNTAESREKTQLFIARKIKEFIEGGG